MDRDCVIVLSTTFLAISVFVSVFDNTQEETSYRKMSYHQFQRNILRKKKKKIIFFKRNMFFFDKLQTGSCFFFFSFERRTYVVFVG